MSKIKGSEKKKDREHETSTKNEGVNDESSSWNILHKCLWRDDESSENKSMIDNKVHAVVEDDRQS